MFSNLTVGIVLGIGVAGWSYAKFQRYNGNNTQNSAIGAAVVGLLAALVVVTLLGILF